ncbi:hypothetical protein Lal_00033521 [Lupinus albus]|nr:hypothetical protein Lal_00033521 [Lupinus albus]
MVESRLRERKHSGFALTHRTTTVPLNNHNCGRNIERVRNPNAILRNKKEQTPWELRLPWQQPGGHRWRLEGWTAASRTDGLASSPGHVCGWKRKG